MDSQTQSQFPPGAMVRVAQICGNPKKGIRGLLPINAATWWKWVKAGRVEPGRKLGSRTTAWPVEVVLNIGMAPTPTSDKGES